MHWAPAPTPPTRSPGPHFWERMPPVTARASRAGGVVQHTCARARALAGQPHPFRPHPHPFPQATIISMFVVLMIVDFMFGDDTSFIYEPDIKVSPGRRRATRQPGEGRPPLPPRQSANLTHRYNTTPGPLTHPTSPQTPFSPRRTTHGG
jgi:hypothetical protein